MATSHRLQPSIVVGKDGSNYDEHLEYIFTALTDNDLTDSDVLLGCLNMYADSLCSAPPKKNMLIFHDTTEAIEWVLSISGLHMWELSPKDKKHASRPDHRYGAFLYGYENGEPVTAHTVRNAALLAVIQRFREVVEPQINPDLPERNKLN